MELINVSCNHCGAPLEVGKETRFVTCEYCKSQLAIKHTGSAIYTEVLERIDQRTERMAEDLAVIRRQNELEALDREWALRRETLMVRSKDGSTSEPSAVGGIAMSVVAVVFGIFWIGMASGHGAPSFMPMFGVVFVAVAIAGGVKSALRSSAYQREREVYERRREQLLREADRQG